MRDTRVEPPEAADGWVFKAREQHHASACGPYGFFVEVYNVRAVARGGQAVMIGRYPHHQAAFAAVRAFEAAEAGELFLLLWEFERLGVAPYEVERILRHAEQVGRLHQPAALADLDSPYRVVASPFKDRSLFSGALIGAYLGRAIMWWPVYGRDGFAEHLKRLGV